MILNKKWEAKPHNCHLDENGYLLPFVPICKAYVIPDVLIYPIEKELAEYLVSLHNSFIEKHE